MNPVEALILAIACLVVLFGSSRSALLAMMVGIIFVTQYRALEIAGFNFFGLRFLEVFGIIRVFARKEISWQQLTGTDRWLLGFTAYNTFVFVARTEEIAANQIAAALDAYCCYFVFRGLIKDVDDLRWFLRANLVLLVPYVCVVLVESFTNNNPFTLFGASPANADWFRNGRIRCWGSFRHPSLLGTFAAATFILYLGLWFDRTHRKIATCGIALCALLVWATNSGAPLSCVAVGLVGWALWPLRRRMKLFRRGLVILISLIALLMNAPIWYIPARVSSISGGDGWHRSYLMEVAFENLDKWWMIGMPFEKTRYWFPYLNAGTGNADMTNLYLVYGISSGILSIVLFVCLLTHCYRRLGRALQTIRESSATQNPAEYMTWTLGVLLTMHIVNWFGITYFDQSYALWYMHLALIAALTAHLDQPVNSLLSEEGLDQGTYPSAGATLVNDPS